MCFREYLQNIIIEDNLELFIASVNNPEHLPKHQCEYCNVDERLICRCGVCEDFDCIDCVKLFSLFASIDENAILIFEYLMNSNILNEKNQYDQAPLHCAAELNRTEMIKLLIQHGADVNTMDYSGQIPLHYAAIYNYEEITELLLNNGSDINRRDDDGISPLGYAAFNNNLEACVLLFKYGANINQVDYDGKTPLEWAKNSKREKIYNIFTDKTC